MEEMIENLKVNPYFEIEDFMNFSKETRLDSTTLNNLIQLWEKWSDQLKAVKIAAAPNSWLAVWLPESVGDEVDIAWNQEPGKGFLMNSLAQFLCMTAVSELLPQTALAGCAPTPFPHKNLRAALHRLGLGSEDGMLQCRYAVISYYPFQGGCEICGISENCPKKLNEDNFSSIVLPGYEK